MRAYDNLPACLRGVVGTVRMAGALVVPSQMEVVCTAPGHEDHRGVDEEGGDVYGEEIHAENDIQEEKSAHNRVQMPRCDKWTSR